MTLYDIDIENERQAERIAERIYAALSPLVKDGTISAAAMAEAIATDVERFWSNPSAHKPGYL